MIINASPLIILAKINKPEILKKIYESVEIAASVYQEVVVNGLRINFRDALVVKEQIDSKNINVLSLRPEFTEKAKKIESICGIDIGEAETIALALQLNKNEVIIDEIDAREAAKAFGIKPIGTLRVLLIAYKNGLINKAEIQELVNEMENSKYRFSPKVLIEFWNLFKNVKK